jgi:hypothetical protein
VIKKSLMIGLRDILTNCKQESPVTVQPSQEQISMTEPVTEVVQCFDQLPILTDAEVTEVLRGLEETFSTAEVEELLRGLEETSVAGETKEETLGTKENGQHYIDDELDAVLDMNIDDYIV